MQQYLIHDEHSDPHFPDNLTGYFQALADHPWAMLLDSAASHHVNSRYDIMVAEPVATLQAINGRIVLEDSSGIHDLSQQDPFAALNMQIRHYFPHKPQTSLPFCGGALGYFGYDAGMYTEPAMRIAPVSLKMPDLAIGIYLWALILDKQHRQLWYVDYRGNAEQHWQQLKPRLQPVPARRPFALSSQWQANLSKADYQQRFQRIQQYLLSGDCYQINLAQRFKAGYQGDEWQAYLTLRDTNAAPFSAFIRLPQGCVLSISPERFLQLRQGLAETKPIKGTRPRGFCPVTDAAEADNLRQSPKDRAENVMIVDLLRNDLGKVCQPGSVKVPSLFAIESFPAVHHLVSTVTGRLSPQYSATDLLKGAFPGGSITGAPKIRAMQIIAELEPDNRSVYCGAIGYISSNGDMDTNITIRTLVCHNQHIYCWAGGGIVADSDADSEYQETLDKVNRILPVLSALADTTVSK
ncbi:aminodeoxychorismate synthase component I [Chromatiaceae bacterium AAb-1]|nr:aminodeoxychorismate synthase component I [Chromatiaceae bacterium AAb-1]